MIQLFETTSIDSNCDIGPNDEPFTMPVLGSDHLFLRLQVPYYLVVANGGGLPIGANINVRAMDILGTTNFCNYGHPAGNEYLYNFVNDGTKRIGEYRFMIPMRLQGFDHETWWFTASNGDEIVFTIDGVVYTWIWGTEPTPYPFLDFRPGDVCVRVPDGAALSLVINGAPPVSPSLLFTNDGIACINVLCFRIQIEVTFGATTYEYFTKMFQIVLCDDNTLYLQSEYNTGKVDCAGQYYQSSGGDLGSTELYLRVPADIDRIPSKISKTINSKCFLYKSDIAKQVRLRSMPVPSWFQDACETLMLGKNLRLDGVQYQLEAEQIFENSDLIGSVFQNMNVPLSQCKCENVFVC